MGTCALSGFLALPAEGNVCAGQFASASQSQSRNEDRTDRMRIGQAEDEVGECNWSSYHVSASLLEFPLDWESSQGKLPQPTASSVASSQQK